MLIEIVHIAPHIRDPKSKRRLFNLVKILVTHPGVRLKAYRARILEHLVPEFANPDHSCDLPGHRHHHLGGQSQTNTRPGDGVGQGHHQAGLKKCDLLRLQIGEVRHQPEWRR